MNTLYTLFSIKQIDTLKKAMKQILDNTQQTFVGLQDVFKTCLEESSTRLQHNNFSSSRTSWKTKNRYAEDVTSWKHVLMTSWRHVSKTSSRRVGGKQNVYWGYLYLTNINVYLTNLYLTNLSISGESKTNPKCIN